VIYCQTMIDPRPDILYINELSDDINQQIRRYQRFLDVDIKIFNFHLNTINVERSCHKSVRFYLILYFRWVMSFQMWYVKTILKQAIDYCFCCGKDVIQESLECGVFNYKFWVADMHYPMREWAICIGCNFWSFWAFLSKSIIECLLSDTSESIILNNKVNLCTMRKVFKQPNNDSKLQGSASGLVDITGFRNGWAKCNIGFVKLGKGDTLTIDDKLINLSVIDF